MVASNATPSPPNPTRRQYKTHCLHKKQRFTTASKPIDPATQSNTPPMTKVQKPQKTNRQHNADQASHNLAIPVHPGQKKMPLACKDSAFARPMGHGQPNVLGKSPLSQKHAMAEMTTVTAK
jgi:hypothetical protein